jgi:uncharacterized membrane protein YeaQ/YmgE (transglycosylase-associated protein family)
MLAANCQGWPPCRLTRGGTASRFLLRLIDGKVNDRMRRSNRGVSARVVGFLPESRRSTHAAPRRDSVSRAGVWVDAPRSIPPIVSMPCHSPRGRRWGLVRSAAFRLLHPRESQIATRSERTVMGIIAFIILGLLAGLIAKAIMPGNDPGGYIVTTIIGIVGALLGGFLAAALFDAHPLDEFFDISTWLTAIIGSIILLVLYRIVVGRSDGHRALRA